jgi:hypothetical protein
MLVSAGVWVDDYPQSANSRYLPPRTLNTTDANSRYNPTLEDAAPAMGCAGQLPPRPRPLTPVRYAPQPDLLNTFAEFITGYLTWFHPAPVVPVRFATVRWATQPTFETGVLPPVPLPTFDRVEAFRWPRPNVPRTDFNAAQPIQFVPDVTSYTGAFLAPQPPAIRATLGRLLGGQTEMPPFFTDAFPGSFLQPLPFVRWPVPPRPPWVDLNPFPLTTPANLDWNPLVQPSVRWPTPRPGGGEAPWPGVATTTPDALLAWLMPTPPLHPARWLPYKLKGGEERNPLPLPDAAQFWLYDQQPPAVRWQPYAAYSRQLGDHPWLFTQLITVRGPYRIVAGGLWVPGAVAGVVQTE